VLYLWLDRWRLIRLVTPSRPISRPTVTTQPVRTCKPPAKPRFINSKPIASQSPPRAIPSPKSEPDLKLDALQGESTKRKEELRRVSPRTQNELYRLVGGDAEMVKRLVLHSRSRNPDRSEQWVWEKTIRDLERDRGYR
jgi:hypothetical protein